MYSSDSGFYVTSGHTLPGNTQNEAQSACHWGAGGERQNPKPEGDLWPLAFARVGSFEKIGRDILRVWNGGE